MARRRASAGTGVVNPLQRMFGAYLRVERSRHGLSSGDIAGRLGLSETYYRLVESGRAALNQALVLDIVAVFSGGRSATGSRSISLPRLSLLLVGANWVGAEMASVGDEEDAGRISLAALAEQVAEFEQLVARTIGLLDKPEGSQEQRRFLEGVVAPEISDFLTLDSYGKSGRGSGSALKFLDSAPTLNIDFIKEVNDSLAWRPFRHAEGVAAAWESSRSNAFRSLHGLYQDPNGIINENNLKLFHFDYLKSNLFLQLRFIFINGGSLADAGAAARLEAQKRDEFIEILNKAREASGKRALKEDEAAKLAFRFLTNDEREGATKKCVDAILSSRSKAYWSFDTIAGYPIGFLGLIDDQADGTVNLNLTDSNAKGAAFDDLWEKIEQSRQGEGKVDRVGPG